MKKILSVITAMSVAMMTMLSAVTVTAAEKITADEVKKMIYSSGLQDYPELWNKTIKETGVEEDVLKPDTRTVKDVIDVEKSYREFYAKKDGDKYSINYDDNIAFLFVGLNKDGEHVEVTAFPENYVIDISAGTVQYNGISDFQAGLNEDYKKIAEIINNSDMSKVQDIKIVNSLNEFFGGGCIYIKDSSKEYAIPNNSHGNIVKGQLIGFNEWCSAVESYGKNNDDDAEVKFEKIYGDEIRDTDTRSAYIGTESKFVDVSGDLASYVNELNDMGIINGYEDGLFMPENNITRAEAVAMLTRLLRYSGKYGGEFKDVSAEDWFADAVSALTANGIINGYNETTFAPYENIKYQEVMKILVCALGYGDFRGWSNAYPSMTNQKAMEIGLTEGLDSIDTTAPITRADMAVMLSNALDTHLFTSVKSLPSENSHTGAVISQLDITLADYLEGGKLNGTLSTKLKVLD